MVGSTLWQGAVERDRSIGEISPQPLPDVAPNVPAVGDLALFGGDRARDLQVAGQQLGQASGSLAALYERTARDANDNRVQDLNNQFLDGRREILRTGPDAYYSRKGAAAIAGADAASGRLTALKDRLLDQTGNGYQRQQLGRILDLHLAASAEGIADHVAAQQDVYNRGVAAAAIRTAQAEATADPSVMAQATMRAEDAARVVHAGQPPEAVEAGVRAAAGSLVAGVIGARLAHNDVEGVRLLRQHGARLDPAARGTLGAAAEMVSNSVAADAWLRDRSAILRASASTGDATLDAVNAASASIAEPPPVVSSGGALLDPDGGIVGTRQRLADIEERHRALTALNQQEFAADPARLRANQAAIDTDTVRSRAVEKAETDALYADLRRHLTTGGPDGGPALTRPPATIMSRLTNAQQDAVRAQVDAAIAGRKTVSDPQTRYAIRRGLTADDAGERQRWAATNLVPFMGRLSAGDYAALETLQSAVRDDDGSTGQGRQRRIAGMADRVLRSAGIDPTPRPDATAGSDAAQAEQFHRVLQDELSAFESKGRPPTEAEAYAIVTGLKDTAIKSGWLKVSDPGVDRPPADGAVLEGSPPSEQGSLVTVDFDRMRRIREEGEQATGGAAGAPATEPDSSSPEYQAADAQARQIVAEQGADGPAGQGKAPVTEPLPGSPEYQAAEEQVRKLERAWENISFFGQLGVAFKRFDERNKKRGAILSADSHAMRQEKVREIQQRALEAPDTLTLADKQYLHRNRNVASDLAGAVGRLIEAQRRLAELPASDPLRRLVEASTVDEAGEVLREHSGEIAGAIGVEGLPELTVSLIAMAALGPIGAIALVGTDGLDGYANGLLGAFTRAGVDVSNADELTRALQDKALMDAVRKDATTDGAIAAGVSAMATLIPGSKRPSFIRGPRDTRVAVPTGLSDAEFELFRYAVRNQLQWNSKTSQRILSNLDMQVDRFIGKFRKGDIRETFPDEFSRMTLRELYDSPPSKAKNTAMKLLRDGRFERE